MAMKEAVVMGLIAFIEISKCIRSRSWLEIKGYALIKEPLALI